MSMFGIDLNTIATPYGVVTVMVIVLAMTIFLGYKYLREQSELARINRTLSEKINNLSTDLGKTRESYERVVKALDMSQQQVIFLQSWIMRSKPTEKHTDKQEP